MLDPCAAAVESKPPSSWKFRAAPAAAAITIINRGAVAAAGQAGTEGMRGRRREQSRIHHTELSRNITELSRSRRGGITELSRSHHGAVTKPSWGRYEIVTELSRSHHGAVMESSQSRQGAITKSSWSSHGVITRLSQAHLMSPAAAHHRSAPDVISPDVIGRQLTSTGVI